MQIEASSQGRFDAFARQKLNFGQLIASLHYIPSTNIPYSLFFMPVSLTEKLWLSEYQSC